MKKLLVIGVAALTLAMIPACCWKKSCCDTEETACYRNERMDADEAPCYRNERMKELG